jgi:outer membrane cobalamin receptor
MLFAYTGGSYVFIACAGENLHSVSGRVILSEGTPIEGASIVLSPGMHTDTTDSTGYFSIGDVPPGDYVLSVSHSSGVLEKNRKKITVPLEDSTPLVIHMHERLYELDEIVVISSPSEIPDITEKTPSYVTVVPRESFEDKSATVAEVISTTPGVNIQSTGGLGDYTEVSLRGANANQVQVYIDDMLLNEAVGGGVNLATIPLTHVQSIEVWRSGAPSHLGGDAVGGVVNIRTRDISSAHRTFSLGYGSFNTLNVHSVLTFPLNMSHLLVTADYSSSDNEFTFKSDNGTVYNKDDDYWTDRKNDRYRSCNLLSKYNRLVGDAVLFELSEHLISSRNEIPGKDIVQESDASLRTVKNLLQAKLTMNPNSIRWLEAKPHLYHIYSHERYKDLRGRVGWGTEDNIYRTNTIRFTAPLIFIVRTNTSFSVTPTVDHESYRPTHKIQETIPLACDREHYGIVFDGFLKTFGERLTLSSSIQRDRYFSTFHGQASPLNRDTPESKLNLMTGWNGGIKFAVLKRVTLKGNYGDITRTPDFYELFGDRGLTISNPDLKTERTQKWDAGIKLGFTREQIPVDFSVEYVYFRNNYFNLIQWYANDAGFLYPDNVARSYVDGKEFVWNGSIFNHIVCSGNWTFQRSKITGEKRSIYRNKKLPNRPESYGTVKVEYPLNRIVPFWSMNHKGSYFLDRANQKHKRYPGRTVHTVGISLSFMKGIARVSCVVRNVTDVHTFDTQGMPLPGRSYSITTSYTL